MAMPPPTTRTDGPVTGLPPGARVVDPTALRRNGAVSLSLVCAVLWPVCLAVPILIMRVSGRPEYPDWVGALTGFGLVTTPVVGLIAGGAGLFRALKWPELRASRWGAIIGLIFGALWLAGTAIL